MDLIHVKDYGLLSFTKKIVKIKVVNKENSFLIAGYVTTYF